MPQLKIHEVHRKSLAEGRSSGISFAFAKKIDEENYEEVMVLSPCKDYINDATWAELTGKKSSEVFGFTHKPAGILKEDYVYLSTANCFSDKSEEPKKYEVEKYIPLIHKMEEVLGFEKTEFISCEPYDILKIDKRWASQPYMTSAFGLFFRNGNLYDEKKGLDNFFSKNKHRFTKRTKENWDYIVANGIPDQDLTQNIHYIHQNGIQNLNVALCKVVKEKKEQKKKPVKPSTSLNLPFSIILMLSSYGINIGKDTSKLTDKQLLDFPGLGKAYLARIRAYEKQAGH